MRRHELCFTRTRRAVTQGQSFNDIYIYYIYIYRGSANARICRPLFILSIIIINIIISIIIICFFVVFFLILRKISSSILCTRMISPERASQPTVNVKR